MPPLCCPPPSHLMLFGAVKTAETAQTTTTGHGGVDASVLQVVSCAEQIYKAG